MKNCFLVILFILPLSVFAQITMNVPHHWGNAIPWEATLLDDPQEMRVLDLYGRQAEQYWNPATWRNESVLLKKLWYPAVAAAGYNHITVTTMQEDSQHPLRGSAAQVMAEIDRRAAAVPAVVLHLNDHGWLTGCYKEWINAPIELYGTQNISFAYSTGADSTLTVSWRKVDTTSGRLGKTTTCSPMPDFYTAITLDSAVATLNKKGNITRIIKDHIEYRDTCSATNRSLGSSLLTYGEYGRLETQNSDLGTTRQMVSQHWQSLPFARFLSQVQGDETYSSFFSRTMADWVSRHQKEDTVSFVVVEQSSAENRLQQPGGRPVMPRTAKDTFYYLHNRQHQLLASWQAGGSALSGSLSYSFYMQQSHTATHSSYSWVVSIPRPNKTYSYCAPLEQKEPPQPVTTVKFVQGIDTSREGDITIVETSYRNLDERPSYGDYKTSGGFEETLSPNSLGAMLNNYRSVNSSVVLNAQGLPCYMWNRNKIIKLTYSRQ